MSHSEETLIGLLLFVQGYIIAAISLTDIEIYLSIFLKILSCFSGGIGLFLVMPEFIEKFKKTIKKWTQKK